MTYDQKEKLHQFALGLKDIRKQRNRPIPAADLIPLMAIYQGYNQDHSPNTHLRRFARDLGMELPVVELLFDRPSTKPVDEDEYITWYNNEVVSTKRFAQMCGRIIHSHGGWLKK